MPRLAIPNQTVRRLMYGYLRDGYRDRVWRNSGVSGRLPERDHTSYSTPSASERRYADICLEPHLQRYAGMRHGYVKLYLKRSERFQRGEPASAARWPGGRGPGARHRRWPASTRQSVSPASPWCSTAGNSPTPTPCPLTTGSHAIMNPDTTMYVYATKRPKRSPPPRSTPPFRLRNLLDRLPTRKSPNSIEQSARRTRQGFQQSPSRPCSRSLFTRRQLHVPLFETQFQKRKHCQSDG